MQRVFNYLHIVFFLFYLCFIQRLAFFCLKNQGFCVQPF